MADWLARSAQVLGSYPEGTTSAGFVPMFFLLFFYYFVEHTEERKRLEILIADFLVELGVIRGIYI